jgi:hypothetical protein
MCSTRAVSGAFGLLTATGGRMGCSPASSQEASPGRIRVAIWPGCSLALAIAVDTSQATACAEPTVRTQWDSGRARPSMSEVSGGSYCRWARECSPTMFTMPDEARLALWMLARPFASPGPRCSRVEAGVPFMR